MRHATRMNPYELENQQRTSDGFIVAAILCAALMVAILALHGGPNLLGEAFDMGVVTSPSAP